MKKFFLIGLIAMLKMFVISNAHGMNSDTEREPSRSIIIQSSPIDEVDSNHSSSSEISSVKLEEGKIEEEYKKPQISCVRRFVGYSVRCGSIAAFTLLGAGIGAAVISGEYSPEILNAVVTLAKPIIIGGTAGYITGWGIGNCVKAKINRKI